MLFLNYRGGSDSSAAALLHKELSEEFGQESVFLDYLSIPPGQKYPSALLDAARQCVALLVIIGRDWLAGDPDLRPIDDPDDWVRKEIIEAMANNAIIVPVLVGEAPRLAERELPVELAPLARLQYVRIGKRHQLQDIRKLINDLKALLSERNRI